MSRPPPAPENSRPLAFLSQMSDKQTDEIARCGSHFLFVVQVFEFVGQLNKTPLRDVRSGYLEEGMVRLKASRVTRPARAFQV